LARVPEGQAADQLGIAEVRDVDTRAATELGLESTDGVLLMDVREGGAAWRGGLRRGCVVSDINRQPIEDRGDWREALEDTERGDIVSVIAACPTPPDGDYHTRMSNIRVPR